MNEQESAGTKSTESAAQSGSADAPGKKKATGKKAAAGREPKLGDEVKLDIKKDPSQYQPKMQEPQTTSRLDGEGVVAVVDGVSKGDPEVALNQIREAFGKGFTVRNNDTTGLVEVVLDKEPVRPCVKLTSRQLQSGEEVNWNTVRASIYAFSDRETVTRVKAALEALSESILKSLSTHQR